MKTLKMVVIFLVILSSYVRLFLGEFIICWGFCYRLRFCHHRLSWAWGLSSDKKGEAPKKGDTKSHERLRFPANSGRTAYIAVFAIDPKAGPGALHLELERAMLMKL